MATAAALKRPTLTAVGKLWSASTSATTFDDILTAKPLPASKKVMGCMPHFEKVWCEAEEDHRAHRTALLMTGERPSARLSHDANVGEREFTYGHLLMAALKFGESLKAMLSVEPHRKPGRLERRFQGSNGDVLAILLPGGPEFVTSFYGSAYADVVTAAISPNYNPKQIGRVLVSTKANVVVTNKRLLPRLCNGIIAAGVQRYLDDYFMEEHVGVELSPEGIVAEIEPDANGRMNRKVIWSHPSLLRLVYNPIWKAGMRPDDYDFWTKRIIIVGEQHQDLPQLTSFADLVSDRLPLPSWQPLYQVDPNRVVTLPHPLAMSRPQDIKELPEWLDPLPICSSLTHLQLNNCMEYNLGHSPEVHPAIRRTGTDRGDPQDIILSTLAMEEPMTLNTTLSPSFYQGARLIHVNSSNPLDMLNALTKYRPLRLHMTSSHLLQLFMHPYMTPDAIDSVETVLYPKTPSDLDPFEWLFSNLEKGPLRNKLSNLNLVPIWTNFTLCM